MKVVIGSDHGGYDMKMAIMEKIQTINNEPIEWVDEGTHNGASIHYPEIAEKVAKNVLENECLGIVVCGTGIGISIAANKVNGIRCALCHNEYCAKMARNHNNANIMALGGRVLGLEVAFACVRTYLTEQFEGGRHATRVGLIMDLE
ncbi:hypothetical protein PCE1_001909 [Barthelona sp. PCE]